MVRAPFPSPDIIELTAPLHSASSVISILASPGRDHHKTGIQRCFECSSEADAKPPENRVYGPKRFAQMSICYIALHLQLESAESDQNKAISERKSQEKNVPLMMHVPRRTSPIDRQAEEAAGFASSNKLRKGNMFVHAFGAVKIEVGKTKHVEGVASSTDSE
ncbi:hypothetical protein VTP01DRAFT_7869 [Rhizomucor pusillus]|uniref:uncharacterized protein n=1 Tax=Rhizomucor pusillus TaxID=4840 RepID=UPI0037443457